MGHLVRALLAEPWGMFTAEFETLAAAVKSANELPEQGFGVTITGSDDKPVDETQDEWPLMAMALSRSRRGPLIVERFGVATVSLPLHPKPQRTPGMPICSLGFGVHPSLPTSSITLDARPNSGIAGAHAHNVIFGLIAG